MKFKMEDSVARGRRRRRFVLCLVGFWWVFRRVSERWWWRGGGRMVSVVMTRGARLCACDRSDEWSDVVGGPLMRV